jgi:hypothetical protein
LFNRSAAYNRMPFSRPFSIEILLSASLDGSGELTAALVMEMTMSGELSGSGELVADLIRELFLSADFDGIGEMNVDGIRERLVSVTMNGEGTLQGNMSRFRVESIQMTGNFAPGEKIIIDSKKLRVTKNGLPVASTGDPFDLHPGNNQITYMDQSSGRTVQIRITHRDKFI